jgi:hypothetical protein
MFLRQYTYLLIYLPTYLLVGPWPWLELAPTLPKIVCYYEFQIQENNDTVHNGPVLRTLRFAYYYYYYYYYLLGKILVFSICLSTCVFNY